MKFAKALSLIAMAAAFSSAHALSIVTNRADINQNISIDWGQFGATYTPVASGSVGADSEGVHFSVSDPNNTMQRRDQGNGWGGNFNNGDHLLWEQDSSTMTLKFARTYQAVGAQIQADFYGNFTATITAYNGLGMLLGSFTENGVSNGNGDNSAIFLGVKDTSHDIGKIVYSVQASNNLPSDFAINQMSLNCGCQTVPEPTSMAAIGMGVVGLISRRRKKNA